MQQISNPSKKKPQDFLFFCMQQVSLVSMASNTLVIYLILRGETCTKSWFSIAHMIIWTWCVRHNRPIGDTSAAHLTSVTCALCRDEARYSWWSCASARCGFMHEHVHVHRDSDGLKWAMTGSTWVPLWIAKVLWNNKKTTKKNDRLITQELICYILVEPRTKWGRRACLRFG